MSKRNVAWDRKGEKEQLWEKGAMERLWETRQSGEMVGSFK